MKTKDIKVGETYAIQSPSANYGEPLRGRVVATGVYGRVSRSFRGGPSAHPNYVEFEFVGGSVSGGQPYKARIKTDGSLYFMNRYREEDVPETRDGYRCPSSHILKTWTEHLGAEAARDEHRAERKAREAKRRARHEETVDRFHALGFEVRNSDGEIRIFQDEAKKILEALETRKG